MAEDNRKKKQHYVPQCYLEAWAIPGTHQLHVYDKKLKKQRINNILDVAEENYFYDIDLTGILTKEELGKYGLPDCDPANVDKEQYIENYFSRHIEGDYKKHLSHIIGRIREMTLWELKNCFFISEQQKADFSYHLALQHIRVKAVRNSMIDSGDCLEQALTDMGASPELIKKYTVPKTQLPYIHGKMITSRDEIDKIAQSYFSLAWILQINRTEQPFFTSDSPITNQPHIHHPFMSMSGLLSKGIEVDFPVAPDIILTMFDGEYHRAIQKYDRRIIELEDIDDITDYNSRCIIHSERCVFSNNGNFTLVQDLLKKDPQILDLPHMIANEIKQL
ncbi:MAG: DUF4238 domain-containing protein [Ruminococcaceae bacterium]|nr:DUF4238 domain-containing protein [Oscillospiraceae bacterium]